MSEHDVRRKILDLLSDGKIDADQATELLRAVGRTDGSQDAQARIIDMLAEAQVSFEQTRDLLTSLAGGERGGSRRSGAVPLPPVPPSPLHSAAPAGATTGRGPGRTSITAASVALQPLLAIAVTL